NLLLITLFPYTTLFRSHFMVTEHERSLIDEKMEQLGTKNMGSYFRKMAIDGYIIHLDLSDIRELVTLLRRTSNSLNQLTKRVHQDRKSTRLNSSHVSIS